MTTTCPECGAPLIVGAAGLARRETPLDLTPSPLGTFAVLGPAEHRYAVVRRLGSFELAVARQDGSPPLYRPHADTCRGGL